MAALHGQEEPLLDPDRFARFLRQANDAEMADVRKLSDDTYEVAAHKSNLGIPRKALPLSDGPPPVADSNGSGPAQPSAPEPGFHAPALRFRRGSRVLVRPLELPLVGVVQVDDEPRTAVHPAAPAEVPAETAPAAKGRPRGGRGRGEKKPAAAEASEGEAAPAKKRGRPRVKQSG
jgi:hypothetical protein